jgi:hypothetical protein
MHGNTGTYFYRAHEFKVNPPLLEAKAADQTGRRVLVFGQPGAQYALESTPNLSGVVIWSPVLSYTLTNSFKYIEGLNTNLGTVFYRLHKN